MGVDESDIVCTQCFYFLSFTSFEIEGVIGYMQYILFCRSLTKTFQYLGCILFFLQTCIKLEELILALMVLMWAVQDIMPLLQQSLYDANFVMVYLGPYSCQRASHDECAEVVCVSHRGLTTWSLSTYTYVHDSVHYSAKYVHVCPQSSTRTICLFMHRDN